MFYKVLIIERKPHLNGPQWKFAGSFYYALVVLALIGYGHSTPNTSLGKGKTIEDFKFPAINRVMT